MTAQQFPVPPSVRIDWPIDLSDGGMIVVTLVQVSETQDYSLRAWVSQYANGVPLAPGYTPVYRGFGWPLTIYTAPQTPPPNTIAIAVTPGVYVLNVLNLTNELNVVAYNAITLT
jgi:hypothetical protein